MQMPRRNGLQMSLSVKSFSFPLSSPVTEGAVKYYRAINISIGVLLFTAGPRPRRRGEAQKVHKGTKK